MHDTAHFAVTYWKGVDNYFDTSEGTVLNVQRTDGFGIFNWITFIFEKASSQRQVDPKTAVREAANKFG